MICNVDECTTKIYSRGYCAKHHARLLRTGSPTGSTRPSAQERFWAKVLKTDGCWTWQGHKQPKGYGTFRNKEMVLAHRFSYEMHCGLIPDGMQVDHMCHNRGCVNPNHLRLVTNKENQENRAGAPANNRSGVLGVTWSKRQNKWIARVHHNHVRIEAGRYDHLEDAKAAVIAKRLELFTHNDLDRVA